MTARGQGTARSGKSALGAAFVARGLAGNTSRDPATGVRKSPGLLGSIMLTLIGGLFFGVGLYVNTHAASLAAKPGSSGSPKLLGWGFTGIGGLVLAVGALTLLSRLGALIIGAYLLIAGRFEHTDIAPVPGSAAAGATVPAEAAPGFGSTQTAEGAPRDDSGVAPLVPPPLDPRLPGAGG